MLRPTQPTKQLKINKMNFYLNNYPKTPFYFLGKLTPNNFIEGHGIKFIKQYLGEFPFLLEEISVIDGEYNISSIEYFFKKINKK